jgi:hypothetical protein
LIIKLICTDGNGIIGMSDKTIHWLGVVGLLRDICNYSSGTLYIMSL